MTTTITGSVIVPTQIVKPFPLKLTSASPVVTTVPIGLPGAIILAANTKRLGFTIYNNSANTIYIQFATTMVASAHIWQIATFTSWPDPGSLTVYQGQIMSLRNSGSGTAIVWEFIE